jgi:hypothetical protein
MSESLTKPQAGLPRVAHVLSDTRVVLNKGEKDGLKINQRFLIFGLRAEVLDPDTNQSLGILEEVRGTGRVIHLQERMATVESDMKEPGPSVCDRPIVSLHRSLSAGQRAADPTKHAVVELKDHRSWKIGEFTNRLADCRLTCFRENYDQVEPNQKYFSSSLGFSGG